MTDTGDTGPLLAILGGTGKEGRGLGARWSRGGLRVVTAGTLAVVYDRTGNEVITVLWAQGESRAGGPVRRAVA